MIFPRVRERPPAPARDPRVYADLDALVRLQFEATGFSYLPRQPVHSVLFGRHASRLRGRGLDFEELRVYRPGDDIRAMDWKASARARRPQVRVFTEERDRPVWLLVDQRASMFFGSRERTKSVTAAEAAAVSAWRVQGLGDRVGAVVFDDTREIALTPRASRNQVMRILGAVVELGHGLSARQVADPGALNRALQRLAPAVAHDALVVLITDALGADETSARIVTQINRHNDVIVGLVYDPMERALPDAGRLRFTDGRGELDADTGRTRLREQFSADFARRVERIQSLSRRQAIPLLTLATDRPVLEQLRDQLGRRGAPR